MGEDIQEKETIGEKILIGPTSIEAGWCLEFSKRARFRSRKYEHTMVWCEEPMAHLFEDFANEIVTYKIREGKRDRYLINKKRMEIYSEVISKYKPTKIYSPNQKHCIEDPPEIFVYGKKNPEYKYDILIHARAVEQHDWIDEKAGGSRNYPIERYVDIIDRFPKYMNVTIASIGTPNGAYHVPDTIDLRGIPLKKLCDIMASSAVCIGTSSFPLHLANACGQRTIVFTDDSYQKSIDGTNRKRYNELWRTTKADVVVLDKWGWMPPVEYVLGPLVSMIPSKGRL